MRGSNGGLWLKTVIAAVLLVGVVAYGAYLVLGRPAEPLTVVAPASGGQTTVAMTIPAHRAAARLSAQLEFLPEIAPGGAPGGLDGTIRIPVKISAACRALVKANGPRCGPNNTVTPPMPELGIRFVGGPADLVASPPATMASLTSVPGRAGGPSVVLSNTGSVTLTFTCLNSPTSVDLFIGGLSYVLPGDCRCANACRFLSVRAPLGRDPQLTFAPGSDVELSVSRSATNDTISAPSGAFSIGDDERSFPLFAQVLQARTSMGMVTAEVRPNADLLMTADDATSVRFGAEDSFADVRPTTPNFVPTRFDRLGGVALLLFGTLIGAVVPLLIDVLTQWLNEWRTA